MTMHTGTATDAHLHQGPGRSRLAVLSLVTSVLPIVSPVGFVLGVAALMRMRRNPQLEGKLLAWAGVAVSVVVTGATYGSAFLVYQTIRQMADRPAAAMRAAFDGETDAFRGHFTGPGAHATAAQLGEWTRDLQARFGPLQGVDLAKDPPRAAPPGGPKSDAFEGAYVVRFERTAVPGRFLFELAPEVGARIDAYRIRRITLEPEGGAIIVFPDAPPAPVGSQP